MAERLFAPAKVNLSLRIFAPDDTGYHPLDTLFCAIDLCDTIEIEPAEKGITLDVGGPDVGPHERNLAYRAANEFFLTTGLEPRVSIRLDKNIPAGAGLGGGSSDAAAVLRGLNRLHGDVLPEADELAIAARLGSDVPFFLCGSTLAHATGHGERLQALPALPRAPMIVIAPTAGIATVDAYRWLDEARAFSKPENVQWTQPRDWNDVAHQAVNDFEPVLFTRFPELAEYKKALVDTGAGAALLSGSGSALFGVYASESERDGAARKLAGTVRASQAAIISTYSRVVQW
jgi:4-diphosphocytidyl-2-C-methyl-D-erythritol kinase